MEDSLKSYCDELKSLIDKSYESFEKQINFISAGGLGLSMLLVEKIVKNLEKTHCNCLLILSWVFFTITLLSNMISHVYTADVHNKTLSEIYDDKYDFKKAVSRNNNLKIWNIASIGFLGIGIVLHIIFIAINI